MTDIIRYTTDKKLRVHTESTRDFPGAELISRKLKGVSIRVEPLEALSPPIESGDRIIAGLAGSPAIQRASRLFGVKSPSLPRSGYSIRYVKSNRGNCLSVIGGDLFGMLAGLSEALLWSEVSRAGLAYRGGDRLEKPAFPLRYYWTWDHSTNWMLDDEGKQVSGCNNQYLKKPETFVEDYKRLVHHCIDMRFNGIVIWGFLRDAHGGAKYAYEVAQYAADRGVAIMPGVGTTGYGGVYYGGRHPYNLQTYLAAHPAKGNIWKEGDAPSQHELSPYYPENLEWMQEGLNWLYTNFPVGGVNMENADFMVDHSPLAKRERKKIKSGEADHFKDQLFAYKSALETTHQLAPQAWNTYATYSGFGRRHHTANAAPDMGKAPYFSKRMPPSAIAQWTLSGMVLPQPVPLLDWMASATPASVYRNPSWPKGLMPPTPRSCGFLHQASQWSHIRRNALAMSTFAEGCLRAYESGLEGISVHGEVTSRTLPWQLNYLTMRHWTYHPVSTLQDFATAELAPRLSGVNEALDYVRALCLSEQGKTRELQEQFSNRYASLHAVCNYPVRGDYSKYRMWEALSEWNCSSKSPFHGFGDLA